MSCAVMTIGDFKVNQCVDTVLCGESMEIDNQEMKYECKSTKSNDWSSSGRWKISKNGNLWL